jgi:hypothetical protein
VGNQGDLRAMTEKADSTPERERRDPHELIDEALDELTPPMPDGTPLGPLDQFAYLATETNVTPDVVLTKLFRRMKRAGEGGS